MIKKTAYYFWSIRRQFVKYFIVGLGAVILDMATLLFLKEALGIPPVIAVTINQLIVLVYVFTLNKYWSFKEHSPSHRQIIRFGAVVVLNYCFSVTAMYIFNNILKLNYVLIRLASIALAVSWNFFLYKYWVYAKPAAENTSPKDSPANSLN
jgi:putative flippase GtrA